MTEPRTRDTKLLAKLGVQRPRWSSSPDGKTLFIELRGLILKVDPDSGRQEPLAITGEMRLDEAAEKAYMFDHMWRQIKQKFLVEDLYGADWDSFTPSTANSSPSSTTTMITPRWSARCWASRNASHTGCYYNPARTPSADATASLGLFLDYDYAGPGLKIAEVLSGGPLDKASLKIRGGPHHRKNRRPDPGRHDRPLRPAQPEGRPAHPAFRSRSGGVLALGGGRQARHLGGRGRPSLPALGPGPAGRDGPAFWAAGSATSMSGA